MSAMNRNKAIGGVVVLLVIGFAIWSLFFSRVTPPDFSQYPAGVERKEAFFSYFAPLMQQANAAILEDRQEVKEACAGDGTPSADIDDLAEKYRVAETAPEGTSMCDKLLDRVDIVPVSLALAQAANESAWGTSRFAQEGNNFFGQWCFQKGCGIVPNSRDSGKNHEVATFDSPAESVEKYMLNLNRHDAYEPLRDIRASLRTRDEAVTGVKLTHGLNRYSERGEEYGKELRSMILYNKLNEYASTP